MQQTYPNQLESIYSVTIEYNSNSNIIKLVLQIEKKLTKLVITDDILNNLTVKIPGFFLNII